MDAPDSPKRRLCFLCSTAATQTQRLVGSPDVSFKDLRKMQRGEPATTLEIFACEGCVAKLAAASTRSSKLELALAGAWLAIAAGLVVSAGFTVWQAFLVSLVGFPTLFFVGWALFGPHILAQARRRVIALGKETGLVLTHLSDVWIPIDQPADTGRRCTKCRRTLVTHVFEIEGSVHTDTKGSIEKVDVYAKKKALAYLCRRCADALSGRLQISRLVRWVPPVAAGLGAAYFTWRGFNPNARGLPTLGPLALLLIPFSVVAFGVFLICVVIAQLGIEWPWLRGTEVVDQLKAGGLAHGTFTLESPPRRISEQDIPEGKAGA